MNNLTMFRCKKDVDRHTADVFRKLKTENERNLRCYNIAKLYFRVGDYESCRHYVSKYLSVSPDADGAHKLLGQTYEALGQKEAALSSFKSSLELNGRQGDLVLKVCELLATMEPVLDVGRAKYWCERGEELFPHHPAIFQLKERLITSEDDDPSKLEKLVVSEMVVRPLDENLRIRLLRMYLDDGRVEDAYANGSEVEARAPFRNKLAWYDCLADVLRAYAAKTQSTLDSEFYLGYISCLDRVATLRLQDHSSPCSWQDCVTAVFQLDQAMHLASSVTAPLADRQYYQEFLVHNQGQICLHMATLILRKAKNEPLLWRESCRRAAALLLGALAPPPDLTAKWLDRGKRGPVRPWPKEAAHRRSQAGHVALGLIRDTRTQFLEQTSQFCANNWRERIYQRIFTSREHHAAIETSHFVCHNAFARPSMDLPSLAQLRFCDEESQRLNPSSLHLQVWLGLQSLTKKPVTFHSQVFEGLQFSHANTSMLGVESLCRLDCDAFLYAVVFCQEARQLEHQESEYVNKDAPPYLPAAIAWPLCTPEQSDWWSAAYRIYMADYGNELGKLRTIVQRGIDAVRALGNHGMDLQLIVRLARTFADRAATSLKNAGSKEEANCIEARAAKYWAAALPLIERMQRKQTIFPPETKMFDYQGKDLSSTELTMLQEEGRLFMATQLMATSQWEDALDQLQPLRSPDAAFHAGTIYSLLADKELESEPKEAITSEMRSKHIVLLTRARDSFYLAQDRLRSPAVDRNHRLHSVIGQHVSEIDAKLSRIDPDMCRNDANRAGAAAGDNSDESIDSCRSGIDRLMLGTTTNGLQLTPRHHQPAPARNNSTPYARQEIGDYEQRRDTRPDLSEQVRQLSLLVQGQDAIKTHLADQTRVMADTNRSLLEANQAMLVELRGIKTTLAEELGEVKRHVLELKEASRRRQTGQLAPDLVDAADDLYVFDDEDYPGDVAAMQGGHFPTFPPYPEYPPLRQMTGLLGTNTVTYGQPPPVDYFNAAQLMYPPPLGYYPPTAPHGALPFSEGQQLPDFRQPYPRAEITVLPEKAAPVNVVITSSDVMPTTVTTAAQPIMSVTVPLQHRHGVPFTVVQPRVQPGGVATSTQPIADNTHAFQISMPQVPRTPNASQLEKESAALSPTIPLAVNSLLSSVPSPAYSAVAAASSSFERSAEDDELGAGDDDEACRDFVPVIPLPAEVEANTGEEDETVLFQNRCKLYRYCDKEWKERGVGILKLLLHNETAKVRLLMRREQVLKICANHLVTSDTELTPMNARAYMWFANDFADEQVRLEKLAARFKTTEEAQAFHEAFEKARLISPVSLSPIKPKDGADARPKARESKKSESKSGKDDKPKKDEKAKKDETKAKSPLAPSKFGALSSEKSPSKFVAGGLTFASTPEFKSTEDTIASVIDEVAKSPDKAEAVKPSPFAGFSFGPKAAVANAFGGKPDDKLMFSSPHSNLTFSSVTADSGFKSDASFAGFTGAGQSVFGGSPAATAGVAEEGAEFVPTAEFAPVIPLPELVVVKTGEENELVLFQDRAKLLRFTAETKEWKERGIGTFKILHNPATGRVRFLMRREQVLKVCCNHALTAQIELKKLQTNDKVYTWYAADYSDEKIENQLLALRFKTSDQAANFHDAVVRTQAKLVDDKLPGDGVNQVGSNQVGSNQVGSTTGSSQPLADMFKPKTGSWECGSCYTRNEADKSKCVACETLKPGAVSQPATAEVQKSGFSFGVPAGKTNAAAPLSDLFKPKSGSWECKSCYTRNDGDRHKCVACETAKPGAVSTPTKAEAPKSGFTFGVPAGQTNAAPLSDLFKPKTGSWECKSCYTRNDGDKNKCLACDGPKPGAVPTETKAPETPKSGFSFGVPTGQTNATPLSEMFKNQIGSWECKECYTRNTADKAACAACSAHNDAAVVVTVRTSESGSTMTFNPSPSSGSFNLPAATTAQPAFSFGVPKGGAFMFGATTITPVAKAEVGFGTTPVTTAPADAPVFGGPAKPFTFESKAGSTFAFGQPAEKPAGESKFTFGSPVKFEFNFCGVRPKSPTKSPGKSPGRRISTGPDDEVTDEDEEGDNIYFAPVIPLPDKVPVCTGEEQERTLYCHRAKLFRFVAPEWKERGVGDFKILKHNETGKIRLLMRRDQILKVCLNHYLTAELAFHVKDDKTWTWVAGDFSEGAQAVEQFALRFKTPDIAQGFKDALDTALADLSSQSTPSATGSAPSEAASHGSEISPAMRSFSFGQPATGTANQAPAFSLAGTLGGGATQSGVVRSLFGGSPQTKKSVDLTPAPGELEVVYELHVTPEEEAAALALQLPANFYSYRRKPQCPGCPGCDPESDQDEATNATPAVKTQTPVVQTSTPAVLNSSPAVQSNAVVNKASLWGLSNEVSTPVFGVAATGASFALGLPIFGNAATGAGLATTTPVFGKQAQPIFGKTGQWDSPVFGGAASTNLFAAKADAATPQFGLSKPVEPPPVPESNGFAKDSESGVPFLPFDANVSFANIASTTPAKPAFVADPSAPFSWSGAGTSLFQNSPQPSGANVTTDSAGGADVSGGAEDEPEHDPHFEPIVPLPDQIEVRTGEEEEEKLFCFRAQLYRYQTSTKEWKERGIGEMKLLRHPVNNTYRLLLRRDQVHKVVLNQLITADLALKPMATSDRAWVWCGMNYAEGAEPAVEELAVRFKQPETAAQFRTAVEESVAVVAASVTHKAADVSNATSASADISNATSASADLSNVTEATEEGEVVDDDDEYEDDDDYEDQDDEGEGEVIFEKRVTLAVRQSDAEPWQPYGQGSIAVTLMYQGGMEFVTVNMAVDGHDSQFVSSVDPDTRLRHAGKIVEWTSSDPQRGDSELEPVERTYQAHFSSETAAFEYFQCLEQAKNGCQNDEG